MKVANQVKEIEKIKALNTDYLLFKGISVAKPNKKDILLTVLKQFAELTKQSIEEVFDISKTLIKPQLNSEPYDCTLLRSQFPWAAKYY